MAARYFFRFKIALGTDSTHHKSVKNRPGDRCLVALNKSTEHRWRPILHSENTEGNFLLGSVKWVVQGLNVRPK